ncbi:hypothetical protein [Pedobacter flavus]|uniref:DUF3955 domain-containing protein n=1 Tax=Pedobacter flavus TaxID=3113906 RepID=A0ABU7H5E7_9SPHI|nr:hypothetical protein [Pedobacter sp. VNH31]MEE1885781.1 hypothetical protein [Pedobacter sp. VNH31]
MSRKLSVIILDIGLILLAYSTLIYFKLDKGESKGPFWNHQLLDWIPYLGGAITIIGFILLSLSFKKK